jgi:hypothetical protein
METNGKCCHDSRWYNRFWCYLGFGVLGVIGFAFFALIFGWVIMVLWNALMPQIFGLTILSFWQAVGLAILARLLFGCSHMRRHSWRRKHWHHQNNCCDDQQGQHGFKYNHRHGSCGCDAGKWQYYEQYWEEIGEKSFKDFVDKKHTESSTAKE